MRNDPHRLLVVAACLDHFSKRLARIPVDRAAEILDKLGNGNESFWWVWRDTNKYTWSALKIGASGLRHWPAKSISTIKFIGGPPTNRHLFGGSLLTLLVDRILRKVQESGLAGLDGIISVDEHYT